MSSPGSAISSHEKETEPVVPKEENTQDATKVESIGGEDVDSDKKSDAGSDTNTNTHADMSTGADEAPPLPSEPIPDGPPLPNEPVPQSDNDGWECQWDAGGQAWFFYNRLTGKSQWENPRVPEATNTTADGAAAASAAPGTTAGATETTLPPPPLPLTYDTSVAGGYNPAIHGDYDPTAWYAQGNGDSGNQATAMVLAVGDSSLPYESAVAFNRFTGNFQADGTGADRHSDEAKSKRQMNAYFDVDAAANAHGGRSLKAERTNQRPSKTELKAFKERRRARKEEKRRAWLRD